MGEAQLIETLTRATTPLVELVMPPEAVAPFVAMCDEFDVSYHIPAVRVIVNRERLLAALAPKKVI